MEYLEKTELLKVLDIAKKRSARDFCMFIFAYKHALRVSELAAIQLDDIRGGKLDCRRLKGSLHTVQPIEAHGNPLLDEKAALREWMRERGEADGSQFLFTSQRGSGLTRRQIYNRFEDCCIRAGIERGRRNIHIAKHSLAAHLVRAGVSVAYLQRIMGHADPKSTLSYTHINDIEGAEVQKQTLDKIFA